MTQYVIDIGAVPDDGQGDPLRTAFDYTNENFNQIFTAGPVGSNVKIANNTITTTVINSNLILSPSGIGKIQVNNTLLPRIQNVYDLGSPAQRFNTLYVGSGGLDSTGGIVVSGNITADYFVGNGSALTGIVATTGSRVENGNSNINIPAAGSSIFVTVNGTGNIVVFSNTGVNVAGAVSATGNITGSYILGNGALLSGINANYSNANVTAFLPTYAGNLVSLTGAIVTTANVTGANIRTSGQITATGNVTAGNVDTGRVNAANITVGGPVSASGNIAGSYILGNGALLSGINANYSNANVTAFLPTYTGNLVSLTGAVITTANVTGGNVLTSGQITATGNITGGNVDTGKVSAAAITVTGSVSAAGNVSGAFFFGDGSQLTNLPAGNYSNANVTAFLPTYTGNLIGLTGAVITTANVAGGNVLTSGQITAIGNVTAGNVDTSRVNAVTVVASSSISAVGNISGNNLLASTLTATTVTATANVIGGNITSNGQISSTGNITGGNLSVPGGTVSSLTVSAAGNIRGGNVVTPGFITATGNITGGNVDTGNIHAGNINVDSVVIAQGNVLGNTFVGNGLVIFGNALLANVIASSVSVAGNVTAANLLTPGRVSASGNVSGNYFVGNGALLTGITVSAGSSLLNGNSNVVVATNGNVTVGVSGISNIAQFSNTGVAIGGVISASGNISASYLLGNGALITGLPAGYSNTEVANFMPTYSGNLPNLTGLVSTTGNIAGNYFVGNGSLLTGVTATAVDANALTGTTLNSNVVNSNLSSVGTLVSLSVQGNTTSGNVLTGGLISATGNILSGGSGSFTGNVTAANFLGNISGNIDAGGANTNIQFNDNDILAGSASFTFDKVTNVVAISGNVTGGNVLTAGLISATSTITSAANISGGNLTTAGLITSTGNITGGNIVTAGLILATGNITGGNLIAGNAVIGNINVSGDITVNGLTSNTIVSATGNLIGGNVTTAGLISVTGNVTGGNVLTAGLISATGTITSAANISGGNIVTAGEISAVANISGGNILSGGSGSFTGNVTAANFFGNISGNIDAAGANTQVQFNDTGDILGASAGFAFDKTGNLLTVAGNVQGGNFTTAGIVTATGNVTGGNVLTGGLISSTGTITSAANVSGGNIATGGQVTATGNITSAANVAGGNLKTTGDTFTGTLTTTGDALVAGNLVVQGNLTYINIDDLRVEDPVIILGTGPNGAPLTVNDGKDRGVFMEYFITAGNVLANAFMGYDNSTGNMFLATNATIANDVITVVSFGTLQAGNLNIQSAISSGNITGGNLVTAGIMSSTGNVTGGNVLTGGLISATGNITSAANVIGGNVLTGGLISSTGNVSGGNILTIGSISAAGNVVGGNILSNNYFYANGMPVPPGITYTANTAPPVIPNPKVTDQWYDIANDVLYQYIDDGTHDYWVDTTSPAFAGGVVANVAISGSLVPVANVAFDIGTNAVRFANAHIQNLYINNRLPAHNMPLGAVVQTVMSSSLGGSITNSTSFADISYANVTITPSSATSKIFVMSTGTVSFTSLATQDVAADTQLVRGASISLQTQTYATTVLGGGIGITGAVSYSYLDNPATTAAVTYKLQQKVSNASSTLTTTNIWLIAMEITAS